MEIINKPEVKQLKERNVAYVSFVGNYIGNPKVFEELFGKLYGWAVPKNLIGGDTVFLASYDDDPNTTPKDELTLEICMTIGDDVEPEGDVKKQKLPGGKYIVMRVELDGPAEYGPAWKKVVEWMNENNLELDSGRPSYEIYLNDPKEHPEKHHILDICLGVK